MRTTAVLATLLLARVAAAGFADHFATKDDVGITKVPRFGHTRILVIPVEVGEPNDWSAVRAYLDGGACDSDSLGPHTFRCFWQRVSAGQFDPEPVWFEPLRYEECPAPSGDCTFSPFGDDVNPFLNSYQTLERFVDDLIARDGLDLGDFDSHGPEGAVPDGASDGVMILFDHDDFTVLTECNNMSHSTLLEGVGETFSRDGVEINLWLWAGVVRPSSGSCAGYPAITAHEFGHLIGFADQYVLPPYTTWGLGLSLMGAPENGSLCLSCSLDAHSRLLAGWANVIELGESGTVEIEPALETGKVYRTGGTKEFWLIENRQVAAVPGGAFDPALSGLAIYHCDESLPFPETAMARYDAWHALTTNLWSGLEGAYPRDYLFAPGDSLEPEPEHESPRGGAEFRTDSNCFDGKPSGLSVTGITSLGPTEGRTLASLQAEIVPATACDSPSADAGTPTADAGDDGGGSGGGAESGAASRGCACEIRRAGGNAGVLGNANARARVNASETAGARGNADARGFAGTSVTLFALPLAAVFRRRPRRRPRHGI